MDFKYIYRTLILIFFINLNLLILNGQDNTKDTTSDNSNRLDSSRIKSSIIDKDYNPDENLKKQPVVFDFGGSISITSRVFFKHFQASEGGGFEPVPYDRWYADCSGRIWGRMTFKEGRFLHLGANILFKLQRNDFDYKYISLVPIFNIDELYLHWTYLIGKVIIGRTNFNLKAAMIFNGPLDGLELDINIPYLNFKTFLGFTGFLGVFNPWLNPYYVTSMDKLYEEETNLLVPKMIMKFNDNQARRLFFSTDFDINFYGQHINPYFLMQYDLTSVFYNMNTDYNVNTFHIGLNLEGRIVNNLYYKAHLSGLFGTHPTSTSGALSPIITCAVESNLRYTIPAAAYSTFILGYAFGLGNKERKGNWSNYPGDSTKGFWSDKYDGSINKKFYYFGKFDGGYVLNPVLSNIHSISLKYIVTPFNNGVTQFTLYLALYQTIRVFDTGAISDDECIYDSYLVGFEIDTGMMINIGPNINIGFDFGLFIPETETIQSEVNGRNVDVKRNGYINVPYEDYDINSIRFKMGFTFGAAF